MALEPNLAELFVVETAKFACQTPESSDKTQLSGDDVDAEPVMHPLDKLEAILSLTLCLNQWIPRRKKVCVQIVEAVRLDGDVADLVRRFERPAHQLTASPDVLRPWHDKLREPEIGRSLEPVQATFRDQFIAELTESKSGLVIAKVRSGYPAEPYISNS